MPPVTRPQREAPQPCRNGSGQRPADSSAGRTDAAGGTLRTVGRAAAAATADKVWGVLGQLPTRPCARPAAPPLGVPPRKRTRECDNTRTPRSSEVAGEAGCPGAVGSGDTGSGTRDLRQRGRVFAALCSVGNVTQRKTEATRSHSHVESTKDEETGQETKVQTDPQT